MGIKEQEKTFTGKKLLQDIGTYAKKELGDDVWVKALIKSALADPALYERTIEIPDVRYTVEIDALKEAFDLKLIFCNFISDRYNATNQHNSEYLAQTLIGQDDLQHGSVIEERHLQYYRDNFEK